MRLALKAACTRARLRATRASTAPNSGCSSVAQPHTCECMCVHARGAATGCGYVCMYGAECYVGDGQHSSFRSVPGGQNPGMAVLVTGLYCFRFDTLCALCQAAATFNDCVLAGTALNSVAPSSAMCNVPGDKSSPWSCLPTHSMLP